MDNSSNLLNTTTKHELFVDGHHLIEKKLKTIFVCNGIEKRVLIHDRTIDDKSYKVTETNHSGVPESQIETEMAEDEVKQFEEDWASLWNPDITKNEIEKLHHQ